jgi:hypothetical protein
MIAGGMASQLTYDGIDICAGRVLAEVCCTLIHSDSQVDLEIQRLEDDGKIVTDFSIVRQRVRDNSTLIYDPKTGYSLGGCM